MRLERPAAEATLAALAGQVGLDPVDHRLGDLRDRVRPNMAPPRVHIVGRAAIPVATPWWPSGGPGRPRPPGWPASWGSAEAIVPPASGAASALGSLWPPSASNSVTSLPGVLAELDLGAVNALLGDLETWGRALLAEGGVLDGEVTFTRRTPRCAS